MPGFDRFPVVRAKEFQKGYFSRGRGGGKKQAVIIVTIIIKTPEIRGGRRKTEIQARRRGRALRTLFARRPEPGKLNVVVIGPCILAYIDIEACEEKKKKTTIRRTVFNIKSA